MRWDQYLPILDLGEHAEIYYENSRGFMIHFEDGKIDEIESGNSCGMALRYLNQLETRFGHIDGTDVDALRQLSRRIGTGFKRRTVPKQIQQSPVYQHNIQIDPASIALEEKTNLLKRADAAVRSLKEAPLIRQVSLTYGERNKEIRGIGVDAQAASAFLEERLYMVFAVTVVAEKDGCIQSATEVAGALVGWELFQSVQVEELAKLCARRAVQKLNAPRAPMGMMPVILESAAGGTMIHEAIGHSLEADGIQKGISPVYVGKIGQVVANEKITVYDNPTVANKRGSFFYDDEGTKSEATVLVDRGILKNYLYDRQTANKDQRPSNGHGRRESYLHKPIPRMSNTYIAPGSDDPAAIVRSVERGMLVRRMGGGQVNPVTGDFVFEVEEGYLIENGAIQTMVQGASLLGNGPQTLSSIDLVGSDHGWGVGTCGKEGQGVPVSDAQPTLRIPQLLIGGSAAS